jgi:hypothetical protein
MGQCIAHAIDGRDPARARKFSANYTCDTAHTIELGEEKASPHRVGERDVVRRQSRQSK